MTRRQAEITYGAIIGAVVGLSYLIGKAVWAGDITTSFDSSLLLGALVGAAAGALAFFVRGRLG
ncbi:MAG: hypothetical protein KDJ47_03570 [Hyphomicrobiaceae bacterium]|nr:hypothetical protein [Hyphomicrobiaceae bacterium]